MKFRSLFVAAATALLLGTSQPAIAAPIPAQPIEEDATVLSSKFSWRAKCPVERIRDTNIVGIINGIGKTQTAARADANAQVFSQYGIGYRLHHCTLSQFSGAGGSGSW